MAEVPYLFRASVVLAANGEGSLVFRVSDGERFELYSIYQKSTGVFDIQDIKSGAGFQHSNATPGETLDGNFIQDVESPNIAFSDFRMPIVVPGGTIFEVRVRDTSGAGNTVEMMLQGKRIF